MRAIALLSLPAFSSCSDPVEEPLVIPLRADPALTVQLTFNERSAWFMFDTGAGAHTFVQWFVDAADMAIDPNSPENLNARDATGQEVRLQVLPAPAGKLPSGEELVLGSAIVAEFPPHFEATDIGGLINPQLLARNGRAVVLDPRVPELRLESFAGAVRRLGAQVVAEDEVDVCVEEDAPVSNLLFALKVRANDREGWLQLDTGSGATSIAASSALAGDLLLETGGETMGVAGQSQAYSVAPNLDLSFARQQATVDVRVVERTAGGCGPDGLLGRDALEGCALVFSEESIAIACG